MILIVQGETVTGGTMAELEVMALAFMFFHGVPKEDIVIRWP